MTQHNPLFKNQLRLYVTLKMANYVTHSQHDPFQRSEYVNGITQLVLKQFTYYITLKNTVILEGLISTSKRISCNITKTGQERNYCK